ncbi:hypothetical protein AEAC466_19885 [Asticcacaulis sp. AC466]|uniref:hypothetical protein n=1 Tax=Asticcacaulis sp. AC466 TaxID=1282362 RepID=UPI0003C3F81E|nr:hypothetical protein [Asticcacaulis sp. AC466]ESQ81826.1 hypothetical protein AEAC466_19885 [Asticcacaulis sp. AC466]
MQITAISQLPEGALLAPYRQARAYTDGYVVDLPGTMSLADYIQAFYTSGLFKLERLVLAALVAKPSTDADVVALAVGQSARFAAWTTEARTADQILMCDYQSKTRSWLMCVPKDGGGTRLYFGSAVVPERILSNGAVYLGLFFHLLLPFHIVYSRALLRAAARQLL